MRKPALKSTAQVATDLGVGPPPEDQVDKSALLRMAQSITKRVGIGQRSKWDDPRFWNTDGSLEERSQFIAIGNAINFRFWKLEGGSVVPVLGEIEGEHFRGSMYLWRRLRTRLQQGRLPLLDAHWLASMTQEDFQSVFTDDAGKPLDVAQGDRIDNLRDLGRTLANRWNGQFANVVRACEGSLVRFVEESRQFRAFDDPHLKLTMVNAIMHSGSGLAAFDAEVLPAVDYHVLKQLLRHGVLRPSEPVARKIRERELLSAAEGMEFRGVALSALVELARLTSISGELLDNALWLNRVKCRDSDPVCRSPGEEKECPFFGGCSERLEYLFPLEATRHY